MARPSHAWRWPLFYLLLLVLLITAWCAFGRPFGPLTFKPVTPESTVRLLLPLFVIAAFLERAQEVFVSTWRGIGRSALDATVIAARGRVQNAAERMDEIARERAEAELQVALQNVAAFRAQTARISFLAGISAGVLISITGVRTLYPLVDFSAIVGVQADAFNCVDVLITGGLLGGGADAIHKPMGVILDFLDQTRERIKPQTQP